MIGAGLVLVGVMSFMFLRGQPASQPTDFSTVPVEVSYAAPALQLLDVEGNPVSLDMYRGQVLLVNLWATWCPPCKAEMPTLESFYEAYKGKGFVVIAINDGEDAGQVKPFVTSHALTFPVWLDEGYKSERAFGTVNLPSSWVIDREGMVRLSWVGAISRRMLDTYVPAIIEE